MYTSVKYSLQFALSLGSLALFSIFLFAFFLEVLLGNCADPGLTLN